MSSLRHQENGPIHNCLKKKKILRINLTKEVKDPYNENYKTLTKLKKTPKDGMTSHVARLVELIL
jgi:hypothetical protein